MIVYPGSIEDARELTLFFRRQAPNLRALRRLVVSREKTVVMDVNHDGIEFPGLTYGNPVLEALLHELHVIFTPQSLHNPNVTSDGVKEYRLSARHPWGEDRVM
ncbi:MAG: hypothetical protein JJE04_16120 [Acidobacteriia bacterium]|nr:hypothetical protein [Terriglobia bacterium]